MKRAEDALEAFPQDLANRRFQYPLPFIGNLVCEFIGKTDDMAFDMCCIVPPAVAWCVLIQIRMCCRVRSGNESFFEWNLSFDIKIAGQHHRTRIYFAPLDDDTS